MSRDIGEHGEVSDNIEIDQVFTRVEDALTVLKIHARSVIKKDRCDIDFDIKENGLLSPCSDHSPRDRIVTKYLVNLIFYHIENDGTRTPTFGQSEPYWIKELPLF